VYILTCNDGTLYTGVTTNVQRRVAEHNGETKGAKYTKVRQPVLLSYVQKKKTRSDAQIEEAKLKKLSRAQKLLLIESSRQKQI
jgi:putative endonuclease